jgi:hypothetical protein
VFLTATNYIAAGPRWLRDVSSGRRGAVGGPHGPVGVLVWLPKTAVGTPPKAHSIKDPVNDVADASAAPADEQEVWPVPHPDIPRRRRVGANR